MSAIPPGHAVRGARARLQGKRGAAGVGLVERTGGERRRERKGHGLRRLCGRDQALGALACPRPEDARGAAQAKRSLEGVADAIRKIGSGHTRPQQLVCAQGVIAIEHDTTKLGCKLPLAPEDRRQIMALLDAWYAERTPVVPTGDKAADELIARAAALRDEVCACTDLACRDRVDKKLDTIGTLPQGAPAAARARRQAARRHGSLCRHQAQALGAVTSSGRATARAAAAARA